MNVTVGSYNEVYDAQAHTITVSGTTTGDKVEYSYDGGATWSETLKQYTNVAETPAQILVKSYQSELCRRGNRNGNRNRFVRLN